MTRRDSASSTGSVVFIGPTVSSGNKGTGIDVKVDWIVRVVKEIKNEIVCKNEIKVMIKEVVSEELAGVKQELEYLKKMIQCIGCGAKGGEHRSYSEAAKEKKKENVIIVKPKMQQESEATKNVIKEKVDIKNMAMGITRLKKGSKGTVIVGCETGEEVTKLKETVQNKLGENYKVVESTKTKPKIKITNISVEEMELEDKEFISTIKNQNRINTGNIRIVKRILREKEKHQSGRGGAVEGAIIIEADEETHEVIMNKTKLNIGWKKCPVFNHLSVKRCFKCWGYYHMAKNCLREEACYKCAGKHNSRECTVLFKKCINCMYKNQTYNLKISDDHEALSTDCPTFKRALQEEKRRAGWEYDKLGK